MSSRLNKVTSDLVLVSMISSFQRGEWVEEEQAAACVGRTVGKYERLKCWSRVKKSTHLPAASGVEGVPSTYQQSEKEPRCNGTRDVLVALVVSIAFCL